MKNLRSAFKDVKKVGKLAIPLAIGEFARLGSTVVDAMFLGHIGEKELAASTIAVSWSFLSLYIGIGLIFALDTLVSQAYGAKNYRMIGIVFQTALFISSLISIPIAALWWLTEPCLVLLRQPSDIASLAGSFNKWSIIGILPLLYYRSIARYLMGQQITTPTMVVGLISFLLNILFNWFYIYLCNLGFIGSPLATATSRVMLPILLWGYVVLKGLHKKTWFGFHREAIAWRTLKEYLKLGIASVGILWFEVLASEAMTILIGTFSVSANLAAHSIGLNTLTVSFIIPLSVGLGAQTRVGNLLGAGKAKKAKQTAVVIPLIFFGWMCLHGVVIFVFRDPIIRSFTFEENVKQVAHSLFVLVALVAIFDGSTTITGCIFSGLGRPVIGTIVQFLSNYVTALPIGIITSFVLSWGNGLFGFWWGSLIGLVEATLLNFIVILWIDWEKAKDDALKRTQDKKESEEDTELITNHVVVTSDNELNVFDERDDKKEND